MASIPLTFAALATSAISNLQVTGARKHTGGGDSDFTAVVLTSDVGEIIVRVPSNDSAAARQALENIGLTALTTGARARLPFAIPEVLGITRSAQWPAVVTSFLPGEKFNAVDLTQDSILLASLAGVFEALHQLPVSVVAKAGLPVHTAAACRVEAARLIDRAWATRRLPVSVKERWEQVLREVQLWDFQPLTIHGNVSAEVFLVSQNNVVGMLGFDELKVSDPAIDFAWLCAARPGVLTEILSRYAENTSQDLNSLFYRAHFYHELELAKWLLHGVETHNEEIIADAEHLLDLLVDRAHLPFLPAAEPPLGEAEVTALLAATTAVAPQRENLGDTQQLQLLDDERVFNFDTDFIEPLPKPHGTVSPNPKD